MSSGMTTQAEPDCIKACTVGRDIQNFELLIIDMEAVLGEQWGDLGYEDLLQFYQQDDAKYLEFIVLALDAEDEEDLDPVMQVVQASVARNIKVILVAEDVMPNTLHTLLRNGVNEFIPYPLPEGELAITIERLRQPPPEVQVPAAPEGVALSGRSDRHGKIIATHGLSGGVGATTLAVNLAWELASLKMDTPPKVCLIDLDLQFGSVATYLDLQRKDAVFEVLSEAEHMDEESFGLALQKYGEKLHVLTAPSEMLPLDLITSTDVDHLLRFAARHYDFVIIDMPSTVVQWTEAVLNASEIYFAVMEIDMRSTQNALRFKRALLAEDLPVEKLRYVLNYAPKFTDLQGKSRLKRIEEGLDIKINVHLPDGSRQVTNSADHGLPLSNSAPKNILRKEIVKIAEGLFEHEDARIKAA